jgi:hypothetical protein
MFGINIFTNYRDSAGIADYIDDAFISEHKSKPVFPGTAKYTVIVTGGTAFHGPKRRPGPNKCYLYIDKTH